MTTIERTSILETKGVPAVRGVEASIKKADLFWDPLEGPCLTPHPKGGTIEMPRKKVLYRSDNYQALGVVGADYKPSHPKEFIESQFALAKEMGGTVTQLGWTERRSKAFCVIRTAEALTLPKNLREKGDPVSVYLYSTDGWDGATPRESKLYMERLVCLNGMTTKELTSSLWVSHTAEMETRYEIAVGELQKEIESVVTETRDKFIRLAKAKMNDAEMKAFLDKLLPGDGGHARGKKEQILHLFGNGVGAEAASRWDALNAVTEYTTHIQTYRDSKIADAQTSRFLGVLGRNPLNERAMELLVNN